MRAGDFLPAVAEPIRYSMPVHNSNYLRAVSVGCVSFGSRQVELRWTPTLNLRSRRKFSWIAARPAQRPRHKMEEDCESVQRMEQKGEDIGK